MRARPNSLVLLRTAEALFAVGVLYFALWLVGVTPAGSDERAFIEMVRASPFVERPLIAAELRNLDDVFYVSRQDYQQLAEAVTATFAADARREAREAGR